MHGTIIASSTSPAPGRGRSKGIMRGQILFESMLIVTGGCPSCCTDTVRHVVGTRRIVAAAATAVPGGDTPQTPTASVTRVGYPGSDLLPMRTLGIAVQRLLVLVRRVTLTAGTAVGLFLEKRDKIKGVIKRLLRFEVFVYRAHLGLTGLR